MNYRRIACALALLITVWLPVATAQTPTREQTTKSQLRFAFSRAPWEEVLEWLAKNADLSLHVAQLPPGSFTYSDPGTYSPEQAIDRINLFLIPQRFSLVRTEKLLSVISLDDEASLRQLSAMAKLVTPDELPHRNPGEVVQCLFPLNAAQPDQVLQELTSLLLIREPALLRTANQILVTDTATKLQAVGQIIARLAESNDLAKAVRIFELGALDAERALAQIRPHIGLDPLAMSGTGISLSFDAGSHRIYASGSREKLQTFESILKLIRDNDPPHSPDRGRAIFRTHPLAGADPQTVVSVLQSLLAEEDIRLAPDATSNQIAVLATEDNHALVEKTIAQLAKGDAIEFKAIPLGDGDLRQTLALLHGIFGITPDKPAAVGSPRIDADPATNRLLIRAKASQIAEIERILKQLHPETPVVETRTRSVHANSAATSSRLAVFYLEHTTATDADGLLRRLLAAESLSPWEKVAAKPPGDSVRSSAADSFSAPWSFRSATIITDSRLNRIFAYGTAADLAQIEGHLRVVDRESSIAEVRVHGSPRIIRLLHADATEIAAVIRDAYSGRIAATAGERREAALMAQRPPSGGPPRDPAAAAAALLATPGDSSNQPRMTLATDTANNSLIVTAPVQLADEVERLAMTLDNQMQKVNEASAEVTRVIPSSSAAYIYGAIKKLQGETDPSVKPKSWPTSKTPAASPKPRPTSSRPAR